MAGHVPVQEWLFTLEMRSIPEQSVQVGSKFKADFTNLGNIPCAWSPNCATSLSNNIIICLN